MLETYCNIVIIRATFEIQVGVLEMYEIVIIVGILRSALFYIKCYAVIY